MDFLRSTAVDGSFFFPCYGDEGSKYLRPKVQRPCCTGLAFTGLSIFNRRSSSFDNNFRFSRSFSTEINCIRQRTDTSFSYGTGISNFWGEVWKFIKLGREMMLLDCHASLPRRVKGPLSNVKTASAGAKSPFHSLTGLLSDHLILTVVLPYLAFTHSRKTKPKMIFVPCDDARAAPTLPRSRSQVQARLLPSLCWPAGGSIT